MIRSLLSRLKLIRRRQSFVPGATVSKFIAKDVKREVKVVDASNVDEGYITAQVRTINVLYRSKGLAPEPSFGEPEILHLNQAWKWGGQPWGGTEPERPRIPVVPIDEFQSALQLAFPDSSFHVERVNPRYGSWHLVVSLGERQVEFVWGPLSGFGGIDPAINDGNVLAYCDQYLFTKEAAIAYAHRVLTGSMAAK